MTRTRLPLILLLCTAFTFSLAACGDDEPTADDVEMQSDGNQEESSDSELERRLQLQRRLGLE